MADLWDSLEEATTVLDEPFHREAICDALREAAATGRSLGARLAEAERKLEKALYIMTPAQLYHFDKPHREPRPDYSDHPQYLAEAFRTTDSASPTRPAEDGVKP